MSLLPLILDIAEELNGSSLGGYNNFGHYIHPAEIAIMSELSEPHMWRSLMPRSRNRHTGYHQRPHCPNKLKNCKHGKKTTTVDQDGLQFSMDVKDFAPNEISVKTIDNSIVIEGKHEERQDENGLIARQFTRRYVLPEGYDSKDVVSQLSSDGVLTVKAPPVPKPIEGSNVHVVQIQQTGPAYLTVANKNLENNKEAAEDKMTE